MTTTTIPNGVTVFDDSPRARLTDPITSHQAADKSASQLSVMKQRVLDLFREHEDLTDSELIELYAERAVAEQWELVRPETPRKRRSDLVSEGYLVSADAVRPNRYGSLEQVWTVA